MSDSPHMHSVRCLLYCCLLCPLLSLSFALSRSSRSPSSPCLAPSALLPPAASLASCASAPLSSPSPPSPSSSPPACVLKCLLQSDRRLAFLFIIAIGSKRFGASGPIGLWHVSFGCAMVYRRRDMLAPFSASFSLLHSCPALNLSISRARALALCAALGSAYARRGH